MADKKTIMIVDDEQDVLTYLTALFTDNGYDVRTAMNGSEAMKKVETEKPDLITLDVSMPEESGIKAYRSLKENKATKDIPIILITGVSPEMKRFISARKSVPAPDGYFEKPIDRDALLKKVKVLTD